MGDIPLKYLWPLLLVALNLNGCAGKQIDLMSLFQQTQMQQSYAQAEKLLITNKPVSAAKLLWENAPKLPPPHRQEMQIHAAEILLDHRYPLAAYHYLTQIDETEIKDNLLLRKRIVDARFYDESRQYDRILTSLPNTLIANVDRANKIIALQLIAAALPHTNQIIKGIGTRLELNRLLEKKQRDDNILSLWRLVALINPHEAQRELDKQPPKNTAAWLKLALLATPSAVDIAQLKNEFIRWKEQNQHWQLPKSVDRELLERWKYLSFDPEKIAVILPLTGPYAKYGKMVRDGLLFAQKYQEQSTRTLQFYNTDIEENTSTLYRTVIADGAELIIGPLIKQRVQELLNIATDEVPIITLNYSASPAQQQQEIFQFGLLPEDEAIQVALKVRDTEHRFVIVLTPNNAWGERLSDAFVNQYLELGGQIRQIVHYDPSLVDYTSVIEDIFQLTESRQRQRQLSQVIGYKPEFSPRIRDDLDAAILFADDRSATILYPQMKYYYVDKLPAYATSHVYTPTSNPKNRDLDGLIYCDAPAIIGQHHDMFGGKEKDPRFRLFALGVDSYNLITNFRRMNITHIAYPGLTGKLTIGNHRRLFRKLRWAKFRNGKPEPLNPLQ